MGWSPILDIYPHSFRACSHGGGGPQVGEVPRLGGVTSLSILFFHQSHNTVHFGGLFTLKQWIFSSLKHDPVPRENKLYCFYVKNPPKRIALWDRENSQYNLSFFLDCFHMRGGVPHLGGLPGQPCRVTRLGGVSFLHVNAEGGVG